MSNEEIFKVLISESFNIPIAEVEGSFEEGFYNKETGETIISEAQSKILSPP